MQGAHTSVVNRGVTTTGVANHGVSYGTNYGPSYGIS